MYILGTCDVSLFAVLMWLSFHWRHVHLRLSQPMQGDFCIDFLTDEHVDQEKRILVLVAGFKA